MYQFTRENLRINTILKIFYEGREIFVTFLTISNISVKPRKSKKLTELLTNINSDTIDLFIEAPLFDRKKNNIEHLNKNIYNIQEIYRFYYLNRLTNKTIKWRAHYSDPRNNIDMEKMFIKYTYFFNKLKTKKSFFEERDLHIIFKETINSFSKNDNIKKVFKQVEKIKNTDLKNNIISYLFHENLKCDKYKYKFDEYDDELINSVLWNYFYSDYSKLMDVYIISRLLSKNLSVSESIIMINKKNCTNIVDFLNMHLSVSKMVK